MAKSSVEYETSGMSHQTIASELKGLGFTNVHTYDRSGSFYMYDIPFRTSDYIDIKIDSKDFEAGDEFKSNISVMIEYKPVNITVDNNTRFAQLINGNIDDYLSFAQEYDGQDIEFDAIVTGEYQGYASSIHVLGKPTIDTEPTQSFYLDVVSSKSSSINLKVKKGDIVRVIGRVNAKTTGMGKGSQTISLELIYLK